MWQRNCSHSAQEIKPKTFDNLSSGEFRWLRRDVWERPSLTYFVENRPLTPQQIFSQPPFNESDQSPSLHSLNQWIVDKEGIPKAWIDVQYQLKHFETFYLLFGGMQKKDFAEWGHCAVSLFISAFFVMSEADVIHFVAIDESINQMVASQSWGEPREVLTPLYLSLSRPAQNSFRKQTISTLDESWWKREESQKDKEALSYLVKRRERIDEKQANPRRPRGLFDRLSQRLSVRNERVKRWKK